jgi:hypothetical protein
MPEALPKIKTPFWVNPISVSLSPELWEKDGLFAPIGPPRDFSDIEKQIRSLYTFQNNKKATEPLGLEDSAEVLR